MVGFMELVGVFWAIGFWAGFELLPVCKVFQSKFRIRKYGI